jgi:hypothetical protein
LDSQLTLKSHHAIRLKEGKKALGRLPRLTGQMGLAPVNCRKVMTACIQSVAMFGSELWWKGDRVEGTMERCQIWTSGTLVAEESGADGCEKHRRRTRGTGG